MGCCGNNRARAIAIGGGAPAMDPSPQVRLATVAVFRYDGEGSLTVIGPSTGRKYWFERAGAELAVDMRDRGAVAKVPKLRQMRLA